MWWGKALYSRAGERIYSSCSSEIDFVFHSASKFKLLKPERERERVFSSFRGLWFYVGFAFDVYKHRVPYSVKNIFNDLYLTVYFTIIVNRRRRDWGDLHISWSHVWTDKRFHNCLPVKKRNFKEQRDFGAAIVYHFAYAKWYPGDSQIRRQVMGSYVDMSLNRCFCLILFWYCKLRWFCALNF